MRYLFPLICLLVACGGAAKENSCEKIKTGQFQMIIPKTGEKWTLSRNDSTQEEIDHQTGSVTTLSVKWINPCEYELRYIRSVPERSAAEMEGRKNMVLTVTIVNVTDNFYDFTMRNDKDDFKLSGRLNVVKQ